MEPTSASARVYKFGPFELSVEAAELRKNGVRLKLQDQPFQILRTLLEHPGDLVSREELCQQLWPQGTFVDFEHGLNTAIKKIRDVLSDDAETPRYIETIPRKGYKFVASLHQDGDPAIPVVPVRARSWRSRSLLVVSIALVVGIGAILARRLSYSPDLRIAETKQLTFTGLDHPVDMPTEFGCCQPTATRRGQWETSMRSSRLGPRMARTSHSPEGTQYF